VGERGPSRKPTELKLLRGETRKERLNPNRPRPAGTGPTMPADMDRRAKAVWQRQVTALRLTGVLTVVDTDNLRAYCEAVARYEAAARLLQDSGPLVKGERGQLVKNPLHQIVRDNAMLIRLIGRDLGFAPGAREGIQVGGAGDEELTPFEQWEAGAG
jgi:P27 family predicted phage terminase small subunit